MIIEMPLWILFLIFLLWISDNYIMVVPCFTSYIFLLCGLLSTTPTQKCEVGGLSTYTRFMVELF